MFGAEGSGEMVTKKRTPPLPTYVRVCRLRSHREGLPGATALHPDDRAHHHPGHDAHHPLPGTITIAFGLAFATVLTLGLAPVLYATVLRVSSPPRS